MPDAIETISQLRTIGINVTAMKKGDFYTHEQVREAYHIFDPGLDEKIQSFERGERQDPMSFACQNVIKMIEKLRAELNLEPLVLRCPNKGIKVLHDNEAVPYLNAQANAGLKKHKAKTSMLFTHIKPENLNDHDKQQLETIQRRHAFIAAAARGARTEALNFQRKGLQLPDTTGQTES